MKINQCKCKISRCNINKTLTKSNHQWIKINKFNKIKSISNFTKIQTKEPQCKIWWWWIQAQVSKSRSSKCSTTSSILLTRVRSIQEPKMTSLMARPHSMAFRFKLILIINNSMRTKPSWLLLTIRPKLSQIWEVTQIAPYLLSN
jgi:hypothetical protein